jgi:hypothetical protein
MKYNKANENTIISFYTKLKIVDIESFKWIDFGKSSLIIADDEIIDNSVEIPYESFRTLKSNFNLNSS